MTEHGGGHLPNGEGDDGGVSSSEKDKQYELLGNIQILSFTASPPQVTPFEPTTLSWMLNCDDARTDQHCCRRPHE
jgi:hypothetical protein